MQPVTNFIHFDRFNPAYLSVFPGVNWGRGHLPVELSPSVDAIIGLAGFDPASTTEPCIGVVEGWHGQREGCIIVAADTSLYAPFAVSQETAVQIRNCMYP
jgi:hypothetical protein